MKIVVSGLFNFNSEVNGDKKDYTENVDIVFQKSENNESVFSGAVDGSSGLVDMTIKTDMFDVTIRCSGDEIKNAMKILET